MIEFFYEWIYALITFGTSHAIRLYPMWKTQRVKGRAILIYIICLTILQSAFLWYAKFVRGADMPQLNDYIMIAALPQIIVPFFFFRGRFWQNIFFASVGATYGLTPGGISIYAADYWFSHLANPTIAVVLLKIGLTAATLPLLIYLLKRLAENARLDKAVLFWRLFWLIPMLFLVLTMLSNSVLISGTHNITFVITRLLALAALMLVCFLLDMALSRTSALEAATLAAEEYATKMGFYEKMANDLKTRIRKILKQAERVPEKLTRGNLSLNVVSAAGYCDGKDLLLTKKEFAVLLIFAQNEDRYVSAEYLYEKVWGQDSNDDTHTVKTTISRLRKKIESSGFTIIYDKDMSGYCLSETARDT